MAPRDDIKYLFIDGGYWREVIERISNRYFPGETIEIDYRKVTYEFRKTFYYDCLPQRLASDTDEQYESKAALQKASFAGLRSLPGIHVYEGSVRGDKVKRRQKMVDTMMAVDMLTHSYRKNASEITLVAGDLDFKPIVDALVLDGMYVRLWYDERSASPELIDSVDLRHPINILRLFEWGTQGFRVRHIKSFPRAVSAADRHPVEGYKLLKKGSMTGDVECELHEKDGLFCIAFKESADSNMIVYVRGKQLDLLEKYVEHMYEPFEWD